MGGIYVDFSVVNQLNSPALNSNTFANRPAAGQAGRLFVSTDTFEIYRDNGTTWDLIGGPGSSTVTGSGAATQVAFWNGSQIITGNNNLWFDPVSIELGVGTNTPNGIINTVGTDKFGILSEINTISGTAANTVALYGINNTNAFGYAGVFEEKTPNNASGQYPVMIKSTLSSGVGAINMATGLHFGLPDDSGTDLLVSQIGITTTNATAGSYSNRINFSLRNNGAFATPFAITADGIGVNVLAPSGLIHADGGTNVARIILDADNNIARIFSFRTDNLQRWALRVDGNESGGNAGANFQLRRYDDAGNFIDASLIVNRATGKKTFNATENYTTGLATGNSFGYTLNVPAGTTFSNPNSITALQTSIVLNLAGNATVQSGSRFGLDAYNFIGFSNTGTLTANQAGTLRAIANARTGWAFNGAATGTITHLAGLNIIRPDNTGAAMAVTNNYGILLNNQDAGIGTVTYTNRWGIYQEGASDLNYFAANVLIGSNTNNGSALQVTGQATISGNVGIGVTPSAWVSNFKGIQVKNASLMSFDSLSATLSQNAFYDSSWKYISTDFASQYDQVGGVHKWFTAPSGTAGNAISFTQAMTLNANTDLILDGGSSRGRFTFENGGTRNLIFSTTSSFAAYNTLRTHASSHEWFLGGTTQAMTLTAGGNVLVGTTTDAGQKLQVSGTSLFSGLVQISGSNGTVVIRDSGATQTEVNLRHNNTKNAVVSFTHEGIDDRWAFGIKPSDTNLYFSTGFSLNAVKATLSTGGNLELTGNIKTGAPTGGTAQPWKLGNVATVTPTSPNRTIEVEINGTTYYIHAKTTND